MTLAHGTDRLESARLVLRRAAPDDLPISQSLLLRADEVIQ
jgi:hypothetical protein